MRLFFPFVILVAFCPILSFAQSNYKPGYVITVKGDTLKGFIDYREWDVNPTLVNFKATGNNSLKTFTPADINYFNIDDLESYLKYSGRISHDESAANRVSRGRDTSFDTGDFFLRVLQKGNLISLFSYNDAVKRRFFYSTYGSNNIHELVYRVYINDDKTVTENTYKQQLATIALKANVLDDNLQLTLDRADYTLSDLIAIVSKMNGLSKADMKKNSTGKKSEIDFYAGVGLNATTTKPYGQYESAGGKTYTSYMPKILFGLNTYANPNTRRLAFSLELAASLAKYISDYTNTRFPYTALSYRFDQTLISIRPQVLYNLYNAENFKFYGAIGFDVGTILYSNKKFVRQSDGTDASYGFLPLEFNKINNLITLKAGITVNKKFQFYVDYLTSKRISTDDYFDLRQTAVQIGFNYLFGTN